MYATWLNIAGRPGGYACSGARPSKLSLTSRIGLSVIACSLYRRFGFDERVAITPDAR
jgi:hypothetical protein